MNVRSIILATSLAASAVFAMNTAAFSASWGKPETFLSEKNLYAQEYEEKATSLEDEYSLKPGFSAADYGEAYAEKEFQSLRKRYHLGPSFTSMELAAAAGATLAMESYGYLSLPPNYTVKQLRHALLIDSLRWSIKQYGLPQSFSYDDYVQTSGKWSALDLATQYHLPTEWAYSDLVTAVGPMKAAQIRTSNGFARNAGHAEIVAALGAKHAGWFVRDAHLPDHFTAAQLSEAVSRSEYSQVAKLADSDTESDIVAFFGQAKVEEIARLYDLPIGFTSDDLQREMARKAIDEIAERYDLGSDFHEADIARSWALSETARVRTELKMRPDFAASEYKDAYEKAHPAYDPKCNSVWGSYQPY